jgi:hypothetical protein
LGHYRNGKRGFVNTRDDVVDNPMTPILAGPEDARPRVHKVPKDVVSDAMARPFAADGAFIGARRQLAPGPVGSGGGHLLLKDVVVNLDVAAIRLQVNAV